MFFYTVGGSWEGPKRRKLGPRWPRSGEDGQNVRAPARGERKTVEDAEDELEDAALDRQDAVSERLPREKLKKSAARAMEGLSKMAPRWAQDGRRWPQIGSKSANMRS